MTRRAGCTKKKSDKNLRDYMQSYGNINMTRNCLNEK